MGDFGKRFLRARLDWLTAGLAILSLLLLAVTVQLTVKESAAREIADHADDISRIISDVRRYYATNVIERLQAAQGQAVLSERYREVHGGIPIPATLSIELGQIINQSRSLSEGRVAYRFLSDHPFPPRQVEPLDSFQMEALAAFRANSQNRTYSQLKNDFFGASSYRLATPVTMQTGCVTCHNAHPDSPKRDWKVGDVRGIQEIEVLGHQRFGLGSFRYMIGYLAFVVLASIISFMAYRRQMAKSRQTIAELSERLAKERELSKHLQERVGELGMIRDMVESSTLGVTIADPSQPDHPLVYANSAFCDLTGFDRAQIIGRNCRFLMGPETDRFVSASVGSAVREGRPHIADVLNYRRDGSTFWNRLIIFPVGGQPGRPNLIGAFQLDISALKNAEVARERELGDVQKAAATAKRASEMKSELLTSMSHELRIPVAGVISLLNLALKDKPDQETKAQVGLALKNAEGLLNILNEMLDVTKIELGQMKLESADFAIRPLIEETIKLLQESAAQKSIQWKLLMDPLVPPYLFGDPLRLRQILITLVTNAIKFTEAGTISVDVRQINPSALTRGQQAGMPVRLQFFVKDTGIGMSEEIRSRTFRRFEQADHSMTRRRGGAGLGLAICKHLVELMGGSIDVESSPGRGSTFFFEVDLRVGQKPAGPGDGELLPHPYRLEILVAEDAYTNQVAIQSIVERMGHDVTVVENGELALQALAQEHFDLVLMDARMPIMDGLEATRYVRAGRWRDHVFPNPNLPIIAITTNATERDGEDFMRSGVSSFLTKPIDEAELHQAITRIIDTLNSSPDQGRRNRKTLPRQLTLKTAVDPSSPQGGPTHEVKHASQHRPRD